jgi:hypothetical protein
MNNINKFIVVGLIFIAGVGSFVAGQFIIATVLFATAAIYSNIVKRVKINS